MDPAESELYTLALELIAETEKLRNLIFALVGGATSSLEAPSVTLPKLEPAELGFIRMVSWLFVLYFETGRISVKFLVAKFSAYGTDHDSRLSTHFHTVRCLRTLFQHHLELRNPDDLRTRETCNRWYGKNCGTAVPETDGHWQKCLKAIILQAVEFVRSLTALARLIEQDDSRETICTQWRSRLDRYRSPMECEKLVSTIAQDMGRDHLDFTSFTNRQHQKWMQQIELLSSDADIGLELRALIEGTILSETIHTLPINGHDIMEQLGIPPGKRVGDLLEIARKLHQEKPCGPEELLSRLLKEHTRS